LKDGLIDLIKVRNENKEREEEMDEEELIEEKRKKAKI
jgi:hypothetical protein